mgnify:FL=1
MIIGSRLISLLANAFPLFAVGYVTKDTRVRNKNSMQTVLPALIFRHKQVVPQVYCQKSNRLLGQNIGS